ncbi:hypothetical protein CLOM_g4603 [Closterium sp. NIES-68]|nr:hypothetical protein CLOM_g4603 [Closterium sp. NIES-68]GJP72755.1 hypothetical protein CLOP_g3503 [Closterium sp. NIES-67]
MLAASSPRLPPLLPPLSPSFAARPPLARPPFMAFAARLLSSSLACPRALATSRVSRLYRPYIALPPRATATATAACVATRSRVGSTAVAQRSPVVAAAAVSDRPASPPPPSATCFTLGSARFASAPHLPSSVAPRVALRAGGAASEPLERSEKRRGVATMAATPSNAETTGSAEEAPLAARRCVPCEGKGLLPLAGDHIAALLEQVPGWEVVEEGGYQRIRRKWRTRNFLAGVKLLERVAEVAEAEGHHPDLHLEGWNHARIDIYTHAIGGLHENDFVLAAKINGLHIEDLLRKPKTKITG